MARIIATVLEIGFALASIVAAILWVRDPLKNYEPWIALFAGLTLGVDLVRRYLRSAKLRVFVSVGATYTKAQEEYVREFERILVEHDLVQLEVGRHAAFSRQPVLEIRDLMRRADAVVVLAFTRYVIFNGVEKPGADLPKHNEQPIGPVKHPTIWNQIEAGIAFGLGKPLLVILEEGIKQEAMLKDRFEFRAITTALDTAYFKSDAFRTMFRDFLRITRRRSWCRL